MEIVKSLPEIFQIAESLRKSGKLETKFIKEDKRSKVVYLMRLEGNGGWSLELIEDLTPKQKIGDIT